MSEFMSWGLPLGRVAGIRIRLHWSLLLFWFYDLESLVGAGSEEIRPILFLAWILGVTLMFGSIFLHELGHCFAARRVGGDADEILMWPLGGLAMCHCPDTWKSHLIVAAGGPAVTVVIAAASFGAFFLADQLLPPVAYWESRTAIILWSYAEHILVTWNVYIAIFNLIPLYPMDGGRILHSALWGFFSGRGGYVWGGRSRASRITLVVSRITAIAGIAYAAVRMDYLLLALFLWALMGAESLKE